MYRSDTIREDIEPWIDQLISFYKMSHPDFCNENGADKAELVSLAIDVWWRLFGELMGWTQSHLIGHSIMLENYDFTKSFQNFLKKGVNPNSHELEALGDTFILGGEAHSELSESIAGWMEGENEDAEELDPLTNNVLRRFISEVLMSRSGRTSFWRMELQNSLLALNLGEVDWLSTPDGKRRQGRPYKLMRWKTAALAQVHFRIGKGMKKYRALDEVGIGIGQSSETLRSWEKGFSFDHDINSHLECSRLAGELHASFSDKSWKEKFDEYDFGSYRGVCLLTIAEGQFRHLEKTTFEEISKKLHEYRKT